MKKTFLFSMLVLSGLISNSQEYWENYIVKKEKGPMVISVNMKYEYARPNYRNLLIVGTHTTKCFKNGYPTEKGLEEMYTFSDSIANIVDGLTKNRLAGIITHQCSGLDIFYVKDTINLREKITRFMKNNFENSTNYLQIEGNRKWKYYHEKLYPKDDSEEFLVNHEFLTQLVYDGDDLIEPREIRHWFYFYNGKKRQKFIDKIRALDFTIDSVNYKKERNYRYELQVLRKDSIYPNSILRLTKVLDDFAKLLYGEYDGWDAELIKKE